LSDEATNYKDKGNWPQKISLTNSDRQRHDEKSTQQADPEQPPIAANFSQSFNGFL
jgi:hypothetical protein